MSSGTSSTPPATLSQVVALTLTYRRLLVIWGIGPVLMGLLPVFTGSSLWILDWFTGGYAELFVLLTGIIYKGAYHVLYRLETSPSKLEKALAKNETRIPVGSAIASCLLTRSFLGPFLDWLGLSVRIPWTPTLSSALWLAVGLSLLGLIVVGRYIGPQSIMRCSTVPLISNPYKASFLYLCKYPFSLLEPSDRPGDRWTSSLRPQQATRGRRFQLPTLHAFSTQIMLSGLLGGAVAMTTVFDCVRRLRSDGFARWSIFATCLFTALAPLVFMRSNDHEIDPRRHLFPSWTWIRGTVRTISTKVILTAIVAPLLALLSAYLCSNEEAMNVGSLYLQLFLASALMSLYLEAMDVAMRAVLFTPRQDIQRLVNELQDDSTPVTRLEVIMQSLLFEAPLVKEVWKPMQKPGVVDIDGEEYRRTTDLMKRLGRILLTPTGHVEAPLEEDILRVTILESFGGTKEPTRSPQRHLEGDARHDHVVQEWVEYKVSKGGIYREPLILPLVRAMCVFVGGMGESIALCSLSQTSIPTSVPRSKRVETWALSAGAVCSAQLAVVGVTRCVVRSLMASGQTLADWKSAHLAMLIPSVLHAIFRLRSGMVEFSKYQSRTRRSSDAAKKTETVVTDASLEDDPELLSVVRVCDEAAGEILSCMKTPKGLQRFNLVLDKECLAWTVEVVQSHS